MRNQGNIDKDLFSAYVNISTSSSITLLFARKQWGHELNRHHVFFPINMLRNGNLLQKFRKCAAPFYFLQALNKLYISRFFDGKTQLMTCLKRNRVNHKTCLDSMPESEERRLVFYQARPQEDNALWGLIKPLSRYVEKQQADKPLQINPNVCTTQIRGNWR